MHIAYRETQTSLTDILGPKKKTLLECDLSIQYHNYTKWAIGLGFIIGNNSKSSLFSEKSKIMLK